MGTLNYADGDIYIGEFQKGKSHGYGKLEIGEDLYEGEFKNDNYHGHGKYIYKTKRL